MNLRLVQRLTVGQLEALIEAKRRIQKVAPLERKRDRLLRAAAKLQKKIDRLLGGGRAPAAAGPGRPRGRKRKLSAAARRKIARAQKARWAKYREAKKAKASAQ
jgi:hypothetical protein